MRRLAGVLLLALCATNPGYAADDETRLRIVFFSDVHARTEWGTPEALALAAQAINAQDADLVLGGGDLITDGFQSGPAAVAARWDAYMAFHDALEGRVHTVIGNHDLVAAVPEDGSAPAADPRAEFRERFGLERTYGSFDLHGYHVVLLDSIEITGPASKYQGRISREQLAWLADDLARIPPAQPVILATHIPLVTSFFLFTEEPTAGAPTGRVIVNAADVLQLFENRNLVLVLQGHMHVSESITWRGTTFVTGGAISGRWWRGDYEGTPAGFTLVELDGEDVDWRYVELGWQPRRPAGQ